MSTRLAELMRQKVDAEGPRGMAALMAAADRYQRTIEQYISGESIPSKDKARLLALACGKSDQEAIELALECLPRRGRKAA